MGRDLWHTLTEYFDETLISALRFRGDKLRGNDDIIADGLRDGLCRFKLETRRRVTTATARENVVIPAKAGIQCSAVRQDGLGAGMPKVRPTKTWIPAFAGMTTLLLAAYAMARTGSNRNPQASHHNRRQENAVIPARQDGLTC